MSIVRHAAPTLQHDYARIWRRLKPVERNQRVTLALDKLSKGATLLEVSKTWKHMHEATLCMALLAYAPTAFPRALASQAIYRHLQAINAKPVDRATAWYTRWHMERSIEKLRIAELTKSGHHFRGKCPDCSNLSLYADPESLAKCYECGYEESGKEYLLNQINM